MGLMYVFPATEEEIDRIEKNDDGSITLKTYGLPLVFWGYLLAMLAVILIMFVAIKDPITKVLNGTDAINKLLAAAVLALLLGLPVALLCFYFYEKRINKKAEQLKVQHHFFGLKFFTKTYQLKNKESFEISHLLDSPNVARMEGDKSMRGFQNKGYFELHIIDQNDSKILVDRHSRKVDLEKIKSLLSSY
jgi:hypothetical protein